MKKFLLLFFAALLSAPFVKAQDNPATSSNEDPRTRELDYARFFDPNDTYRDSVRRADLRRGLLTNEEFFEKADLIAECKQVEFLGYYDAKGNYNPDDFYMVFKVLVLKVFKGDTSLAGKTISYMKRGGVVYKPPVSEGEPSKKVESHDFSLGMDNSLSISSSYSSIQFLMISDYPENPDKSKIYPQPKYRPLQDREDASLIFGDESWADDWRMGKITGLNDLVFNNRKELYEYMSQYKGITISSPTLSPITPKIDYDDFDSTTREAIEKKWNNPEKKSLDSSKNSNTLTLTIAN